MIKGSPIVCVRFPEELLAKLDGAIKRVNNRRHGTPFERSDFIRTAVEEKIAHYQRSSRQKKKREVKP